MFKPHIGICTCHDLKRLIVVRAGLCKQGNDERKCNSNNRKQGNRNGGRQNSKKHIHGTGTRLTRGKGLFGIHKDDGRLEEKQSIAGVRIHDGVRNSRRDERTGPKSFRRNVQKPKKRTGELDLFRKLYEERGPYSQVSGQWVEFSPACFSHILSKGAYPKFRLYEKNIVIKTFEEHRMWETQRQKLKGRPEWAFIFDLEQELKEEYYKNK